MHFAFSLVNRWYKLESLGNTDHIILMLHHAEGKKVSIENLDLTVGDLAAVDWI